MHVLVIGGGGREHALAWRLARAGHRITAAPGNPGIAALGDCVPIKVGDHDRLIALALDPAHGFELVVVGPEAPLVDGLADKLRARGVAVFGPGAAGARLEGSKVFSKQFFARHGIPTAAFAVVTTAAEADAAIERLGDDVVVKVDGLAAGKGVIVCDSRAAARTAARELLAGKFGNAGEKLVIEQKIRGREVSIIALTDGARLQLVAPAEDHKTIFDGDRGPNTGGMGTVSPAWVAPEVVDRALHEILVPTLVGLAAEGIDYRGVLYAGVMVDADGRPWLLEYNCRFGDPETQPVMARLTGDLGAVLLGAATGAMPVGAIGWDPRAAVCVVIAAAGYPGEPRTGDPITGALIEASPDGDVVVFHAGTARTDAGGLVSAGGRVLGVTALGADVGAARAAAYAAVDAIELAGKQVRRDIGARPVPGR
jgi:phosphoribosylamine--glycine ligase